jgi:hypothetical protein
MAAAQQPAQLHLLGGTAGLCDDWGGDDRDDPGLQPDPVLSPGRWRSVLEQRIWQRLDRAPAAAHHIDHPANDLMAA